MSELTTFASRLTMPNGVMVAHQILVLFVWVRVLFGQQNSKPRFGIFFFFIHTIYIFFFVYITNL